MCSSFGSLRLLSTPQCSTLMFRHVASRPVQRSATGDNRQALQGRFRLLQKETAVWVPRPRCAQFWQIALEWSRPKGSKLLRDNQTTNQTTKNLCCLAGTTAVVLVGLGSSYFEKSHIRNVGGSGRFATGRASTAFFGYASLSTARPSSTISSHPRISRVASCALRMPAARCSQSWRQPRAPLHPLDRPG